MSSDGWRYIFWIQAAFHGATSLGLFLFYWPPKNVDYPKMSIKHYIWACDPIGSVLFVCSATLLLLALDWAGGAYTWSDPHVAAPLATGLALLVIFGAYGESLSHHQQRCTSDKIDRMEGSLGWPTRSCILQEECQLCIVDLRLCRGGMDLLQRCQLGGPTNRAESGVPDGFVGYLHPTAQL